MSKWGLISDMQGCFNLGTVPSTASTRCHIHPILLMSNELLQRSLHLPLVHSTGICGAPVMGQVHTRQQI